jgi:hypothetical protein
MIKDKDIKNRWLKRSFLTDCEHRKFIQALELHQNDKMDLRDINEIFETLIDIAIDRSIKIQNTEKLKRMFGENVEFK